MPSILQDRLLGALEHQDYQFDRGMDDLGQEECEDRFPVTGFFASHMEIGSEPVVGVHPMEGDVKFDAMAYVLRHGGEHWLEIQARRSIFSAEELDTLLRDVLAGWKDHC